jgi:hypothetical protein
MTLKNAPLTSLLASVFVDWPLAWGMLLLLQSLHAPLTFP